MNRSRIRTKIAIGTGTILSIGIASMAIIYGGLSQVRRALEQLTDVTEPIHTATHEMEINVNGLALGVLKYRLEPSSQHLRDIEEDVRDFEAFHARYSHLLNTQREAELARETGRLFREIKTVTGAVITAIDDQNSAFSTVDARFEEISTGETYAYLLGHTSLREHLEFMTSEPIGADAADVKRYADDWRVAHDAFLILRREEAEWADDPPVGPIPGGREGLVSRVHSDPIFRRAFAAVPATLGLVELDRLVVTQKTINLDHVRRLKERLGPAPEPETIFRLCLPFEHETPTPRIARISDTEFVFVSESSDLRFLDAVLLRPDQVPGYGSSGPVAGLVGLVVGYGLNYLNAIACQGRLVLNNGFHRAYTLRELGATRVPCVIQQVTRPEELGVVGNSTLRREPEVFLDSPRPPVLKDFFDPRLCARVLLIPTKKHIRISFNVEGRDMP